MDLSTAATNHGLTEINFFKSKTTKRLVSFNKTIKGMIKFVTTEDCDTSKPMYAHINEAVVDYLDEESGVVMPCQMYWVSNNPGGSAKAAFTFKVS